MKLVRNCLVGLKGSVGLEAVFQQSLAGKLTEPAVSARLFEGGRGGRKESRMSALIRWDPFKEMDELQSKFAKMFGLTPARSVTGGLEAMTTPEWAPSVDIVEDKTEWVVKADLPEVKKEDVKVSVENGLLTITGERKFEKEEKDKKYHRIERSYGNFLRSFSLPDGTDGSKATADFKDGVLKVHVPKSEKALPKAVDVKVA
jgi:HSP20 family protein